MTVAAADVLVLGAGPAGAAVARALCRYGVPRVHLLDRPSRAPYAIGESAAPQLAGLLARLGLPDRLEQLGHAPYHGNRSLWGGPPVVDDFLRRGTGHGWHLDRRAFDAWLRDAAAAAGARLAVTRGLAGIERIERGWCVAVRGERGVEQITATVVVDATGRAAAIGRRLGAHVHRLDGLVALAVEAAPRAAAADLAGLSLIEPVADGWWYAAGLPSGRVMLTLMTDADVARAARLTEPARFHRALDATCEVRQVAELTGHDPRPIAVYRAHTQYLDRAVGPGWIAVGDSLLSLDPLTSSGIVGAIDDACAAAQTVITWFGASGAARASAGRDYTRRVDQTLRRYLVERRSWYGREPRWADRAFWRRRSAPPLAPDEPEERTGNATSPGSARRAEHDTGTLDNAGG